jgi:hypothetical protein
MHFGMLMTIGAPEPVSQQQLSRRTGIDRAAWSPRWTSSMSRVSSSANSERPILHEVG